MTVRNRNHDKGIRLIPLRDIASDQYAAGTSRFIKRLLCHISSKFFAVSMQLRGYSKDRTFRNRLTIMIHPGDARHFGVNLFEIRDYLGRSLHI